MKRVCIVQNMSRVGGKAMTQMRLRLGHRVQVALFLRGRKNAPTRVNARVVRVDKRSAHNSYWKYDAALRFEKPGGRCGARLWSSFLRSSDGRGW